MQALTLHIHPPMGYADLKLRSLSLARRALICTAALALLGTAVAPAHAQTETFKVGTFTKTCRVVHQISASNVTNSALTLSITGFVPGTGANRLLVVGLSSSNTLTGITVSFAGNALTAVPSSAAANTVRTQFFYLVNPPSASGTVTATWTTTARALVMGATVFNNVDQTTPFQNAITATGTSTTPSIAVTTGGGNMTIAIAAKTTNLGAPTPRFSAGSSLSAPTSRALAARRKPRAAATSTTHTAASGRQPRRPGRCRASTSGRRRRRRRSRTASARRRARCSCGPAAAPQPASTTGTGRRSA